MIIKVGSILKARWIKRTCVNVLLFRTMKIIAVTNKHPATFIQKHLNILRLFIETITHLTPFFMKTEQKQKHLGPFKA